MAEEGAVSAERSQAPGDGKPQEAVRAEVRILKPHAVAVDLRPFCEPEPQLPGQPLPTEAKPEEAEEGYRAIVQGLSSHPDYVGLVKRAEKKQLLFIFEQDFQDWASVQEKVSPLEEWTVSLRPGCHSRAEREKAKAALQEIIQDPSRPAVHSWLPDPAIAGFRVWVEPGHEEEAAALKKQFGSIVNVWLGPPVGILH